MRATRKLRWLKKMDRYAGIPMVAALAPLRLLHRPPGTVRRIGVMKTAAIGDLVLASGAIADLHAAFPGAELSVVTGPDNAGVVPLLPFTVARHAIVSPVHPLASISRVRSLALDVLVDFGSWPRFDALLAGVSGAQWRVGFRRRGQGRHWAFDQVVDHSPALHEIDNYRALVGAVAGRAMDGTPPRLVPSPMDRCLDVSNPYLVFHPWSGGDRGAIKEWPEPRWVELADRLGREFSYVVTAGPSDVTRSEAVTAALRRAGLEACTAALPLGETAAVLAGSVAVVCVNTGVMHLAAAVGARTLSLEGPVPIERWGPVGSAVASVRSAFDGCGYLDLGFEYDGRRTDCMNGIDVARVEVALRDLIARDPQVRRGPVDPSQAANQ